jgi:hypothetical protein
LVAAIVSLTPILLFAGGGKEDPTTVEAGSRFVQVDDQWSFSWRFLEDEIEFTVSAPTTGWVAIGFNPSRMMKDADYKIGYVSDGELVIRDDYGTGNTKHESDESVGGTQDVRPISGTEENGVTTIVFALPLDSGDQFDAKFVQGESYKVLLAYGADSADNFTGMHRERSSVDVVLQ